MPSKYNSTANKPGKAVKKGYARGGMAHDKKVLRNLDDEVYRIAPKERMGGAEGRDARDERRRINREKDYEKRHMATGGSVQDAHARLDDKKGSTKPRAWGRAAERGWQGGYDSTKRQR